MAALSRIYDVTKSESAVWLGFERIPGMEYEKRERDERKTQ